jgi:hypothetical protein
MGVPSCGPRLAMSKGLADMFLLIDGRIRIGSPTLGQAHAPSPLPAGHTRTPPDLEHVLATEFECWSFHALPMTFTGRIGITVRRDSVRTGLLLGMADVSQITSTYSDSVAAFDRVGSFAMAGTGRATKPLCRS